MHGNRKTNLNIINSHFEGNKKIKFISIHNDLIEELYRVIREFSKDIFNYYKNEETLIFHFSEFKKYINRFFTSIDLYEDILKKNKKGIITILKSIKPGYPTLFEKYAKPIVLLLQKIETEYAEVNFLQDALKQKLQGIASKDTYIVTRFSSETTTVYIDSISVPVMKLTDFIKQGVLANNIVFIGSPRNFDRKYSTLFFGINSYFLTYDMFDNQIQRTKNFQLLKKDDSKNTIYDGINIQRGVKGAIFEEDLITLTQALSEEQIISSYNLQHASIKESEQVECRVLFLENNSYMFVPYKQKVRRLNRDNLSLDYIECNLLQQNDLILVRNNSSSDLVIDVANKILGDESEYCRAYQKKWKKRLAYNLNKLSMDKTIKLFQAKKVTQANQQNIRNWLTPESISPQQLVLILKALKFDKEEIEEIRICSDKIHSAHLRAGRLISKELITSIDESILEVIDEQGYATFTSENLNGASMNIEVVKRMSEKTIIVDRKDILKIIGG